MSLSAFIRGVTAAWGAGGVCGWVGVPYISPEPTGQHQMLNCARPEPRGNNPESESGAVRLISCPLASRLLRPSGMMIFMFLLMNGVSLMRQSTFSSKFLKDFSVQRLLSPV